MEEPKRLIPFAPFPVRARHDGWTVEKQYAFIEALAEIVEDHRAQHVRGTGEHDDCRRLAFAAFRGPSVRTFAKIRGYSRARRGHNFGNFRGLIQFRLPLTQDVIADATGLTSVHVNRILQKLRADRLINLSRGELALLDVERLKKLDGFDPNYLHRERLRAA